MNKDGINIEENEEVINDENQIIKEEERKAGKNFFKTKEGKVKTELDNLKKDTQELKDKYIRLVAEYDNYRKRTSKEKIEIRENVKSDILLDFLPVIDDIDRAYQHTETATDIEATKQGVMLINNKFHDFLSSMGISEINALDEDFDTDLHEAVSKFPAKDESQKGKVIDVLQKGYKIGDKVIRFAKVVVGE